MESSLKIGFVQISLAAQKMLSCPNFWGAGASPARTPMASGSEEENVSSTPKPPQSLGCSSQIFTLLFCKLYIFRAKLTRTLKLSNVT